MALRELGITLDRAQVEVLDISEKGFIFKKKIVTVKVWEKEEDFDVKEIFAKPAKREPKKDFKREQRAEKPKKDRPKAEKPQPAPRPAAEEKEEKPAVTEEPAQPREAFASAEERPEFTEELVAPENYTSKLTVAMEYLKGILTRFDGDYVFDAYTSENGYVIKISGQGLGAIIGRKGETMEALSYLTGLAANRAEESSEKITVDIADYRQKREKDLVAGAKKAAAKVLRTGRPFGFEPMNPYDRRIIHATVSEIEGVKSESKGEGPRRRVVIYSTTPRPRYNKGDRRPPQGGRKPYNNSRNGKYGRDRRERPAPQVQKTREEKLVDASSFGLYSKIDL